LIMRVLAPAKSSPVPSKIMAEQLLSAKRPTAKDSSRKSIASQVEQLYTSQSHVTLTPSGSDINKVGVIPDITVADKKEQERVAKECIREKIASLKPVRTSSLTLTK
jgi:hypothetical protein